MRACRLERGVRGALWAIIASQITGTAALAQSEARPWESVTEQRLLNPRGRGLDALPADV